ncbi:MAG: carbon-nitrogen hydrolase family protein [Chromatiales bacterium]|nr:carbon-nitrogen hydrolase family protein [Chromatiales bacterium]
MTEPLPLLAAVQLASGPNVNANLLEAERLIAQAAAAGAKVVVLPENFAFMGKHETDKLGVAEPFGEGPIQHFLAHMASTHGLWLVGGTMPMRTDNPHKVRAACLVFNASGEFVARYDKMHLFDVNLVDHQERYAESETIEPGTDVTVFETPCGRMGVAVCYDLRFPELFRTMLRQEVTVLAIPSSFTAITGKAHWEVLVRARAIENLSYVVAAAQGGYHINGRETHGHSMIVDPWGVVLAELPRGSGVVTAEYDLERLRATRRNFPSIQHRRIFCGAA